MYFDSGEGPPYRFLEKIMVAIMDSEINWIIVPSCMQQNDVFSYVIFCLGFVRVVVENLGLC